MCIRDSEETHDRTGDVAIGARVDDQAHDIAAVDLMNRSTGDILDADGHDARTAVAETGLFGIETEYVKPAAVQRAIHRVSIVAIRLHIGSRCFVRPRCRGPRRSGISRAMAVELSLIHI